MTDAFSKIEAHLRASSDVKLALIEQAGKIAGVAEALLSVVRGGGTIFTCGNGGSACDAMHFVEELVARYLRERPGIRAQHLLDPGTLTCWANDYNFAGVFERQVETFLTEKDALVVFSTSGNSENILRALAAANNRGVLTIALLGRSGGAAKSLVKHALIMPSDSTANIQEGHITVVHLLCELLETALFPDK